MFFVHTSAGGIIDTSDCTQAQPARQIARLGDVCVSPYALNWNCKLADYSEQVRMRIGGAVLGTYAYCHCLFLFICRWGNEDVHAHGTCGSSLIRDFPGRVMMALCRLVCNRGCTIRHAVMTRLSWSCPMCPVGHRHIRASVMPVLVCYA